MAGHLFVMQGDLTEFCCDDWLLPSDPTAHVTRGWWRPWLQEPLRATGAWCKDVHKGEKPTQIMVESARPLEQWSHEDGPRPWLMNIRGRALRMEAVRHFLSEVAGQSESQRHLKERARRLVALPVIGTGYGGSRYEAGKVLAALVPLLREEARRLGLDIVLVTRSDGDFTAGQQARASLGHDAWDALPADLQREADNLALLAASGQLVFFLGAGVSAGAGLPQWGELLMQLAESAGFQEPEREAFSHLESLDQAEYLAQKLGGHEAMGQMVARQLRAYRYYSLGHGLLASIPFSEAVTTNYDQLFEQACRATGRPLAVLPYAPTTDSGRWLLKMHGCLDYPNDIVLTRQSYLRYAERNAALAGIVQAMLITKHMMFAGFSLSDENFLRIVDAVRRAVHPYHEAARRRGLLGTTTMLFESPLLQTLWQDEIHWVCMGKSGEDIAFPQTIRRFEIFLDLLAFRASAQSHLLDYRFRGILSESDRRLKHLLMPLLKAPQEARDAAAWPHVAALLRQLGGRLREPEE